MTLEYENEIEIFQSQTDKYSEVLLKVVIWTEEEWIQEETAVMDKKIFQKIHY